MKKLITCVITFCLLISFSFANGSSETEGIPVIWAKSGPEGTALLAVAEVYQEETGKQVDVVIQGRSGYRPAYNTALLAGSSELDAVLDTAFVVPGLAAGGHILSIDKYVKEAEGYDLDDFEDVIESEMSYNGEWYMFPTDISAESLVYRKDLFEKAPETWEELIEMAKQFTRSINPDSPTEYGFGFSGANSVLEGTFQGIMKAYGATLVDENTKEIKVDSPEAKEAFQIYVDMRNKWKIVPPDVTAWDYAEPLIALQEGIVASAQFFTAGMPDLYSEELTPNLAGQFEFVAQPAGPYGSFTRINPLGIMVNANGEHREETIEFLLWLTGKEGGRVYTDAGGASPRKSIMSDPKYMEERPWYKELLKATEHGVGSIRIAEQAIIKESFNKWASLALNGDMSVSEAFDSAAAEMRNSI